MYCIKEKENQVQLIPCGFGKKKCDVESFAVIFTLIKRGIQK